MSACTLFFCHILATVFPLQHHKGSDNASLVLVSLSASFIWLDLCEGFTTYTDISQFMWRCEAKMAGHGWGKTFRISSSGITWLFVLLTVQLVRESQMLPLPGPPPGDTDSPHLVIIWADMPGARMTLLSSSSCSSSALSFFISSFSSPPPLFSLSHWALYFSFFLLDRRIDR